MGHGRSQKYARYWCWTKGCGDVSLRGERLEGNFSTLLGIIQPQAHLLAEIPQLAAHQWADRKERIAADSRALLRRLDDQVTLNQRAIKARLLEKLSEEDFRAIKASIASETAKLQEQIAALDGESVVHAGVDGPDRTGGH